MRYIVMRRAVLMEDEGRHHFIASFGDKKQAKLWIDTQKGYFGPGDYYIAEVPDASDGV